MYAAGVLPPPPNVLTAYYRGRPQPVNTTQPYGAALRAVVGLPPGAVPPLGTVGGLLPVRRQASSSAKHRITQPLRMAGVGRPLGATAEPAYVRRVQVIGELPSWEEAPMQRRGLGVGVPADRVGGFLVSGLGEVPHHVERRRRWGADDEALSVEPAPGDGAMWLFLLVGAAGLALVALAPRRSDGGA